MLKYKGGMNPSPVIEAQYADGIALKLSFWCDKKKGIDPQAGIRMANMVHASTAWDRANDARLQAAYYRPQPDKDGIRSIDGAKSKAARVVLDELNAERVAFIHQCTDQPLTAFFTHPNIKGRWRADQFEAPAVKKGKGVLSPDGGDTGTDYKLAKEATSAWITVGNISVYIMRYASGVSVELLKAGDEEGELLDNCYADFPEVK